MFPDMQDHLRCLDYRAILDVLEQQTALPPCGRAEDLEVTNFVSSGHSMKYPHACAVTHRHAGRHHGQREQMTVFHTPAWSDGVDP